MHFFYILYLCTCTINCMPRTRYKGLYCVRYQLMVILLAYLKHNTTRQYKLWVPIYSKPGGVSLSLWMDYSFCIGINVEYCVLKFC